MKRMLALLVMALFLIPSLALAAGIEENDVGAVTTAAPAVKKAAPTKADTVTAKPATAKALPSKAATGTTVKADTKAGKPIAMQPKGKPGAAAPAKGKSGSRSSEYGDSPSYSPRRNIVDSRAGSFRAGFIGPGFGVASKGWGPFMTMGLEGEYFIWEPFSVGLRMEVGTKFKSPTLLSFVPTARYTFDISGHPRWTVYAQGGVGVALALGGGTYAMVDISLPGGGFSWQWTEHWSVGADTNLHVFVHDGAAVGWTLAPTVRYQF